MRDEPKEDALDFSRNGLAKSGLSYGPRSTKIRERGKPDDRIGPIDDRFGLIVLKNSA